MKKWLWLATLVSVVACGGSEASEQQAALAAASTRAALESTLPGGRIDAGRRTLVRLVGHTAGDHPELAESDIRKGQLTRLRELQLLAREGLIDAELGLGRHDWMIPEIEALIGEDPYREHQWGRLMVALYRSGRQAEALRCFGELEELLVDQLGIDPSPEMQRLQLRIVEQDPDLDFVPLAVG